MQECLTLHTSLSAKYMQRKLWKGFFLAFLGVLALAYWGAFAGLPTLQTWGFWIFISSLTLIAIGLLPYRRFSFLQIYPNELRVVGWDYIEFYIKGKKILMIPVSAIDHFNYSEDKHQYGLAFWLKHPLSAKIVVYSPKELTQLPSPPLEAEKADLFLPYFSRRAYKELKNWQLEIKTEDI